MITGEQFHLMQKKTLFAINIIFVLEKKLRLSGTKKLSAEKMDGNMERPKISTLEPISQFRYRLFDIFVLKTIKIALVPLFSTKLNQILGFW